MRIGLRDLKRQILEYVKGMRRTYMVSQDVEPYGERKREHFPFRGTIEIDMRQVIAILQVDNRIHKLGIGIWLL